MTPGEKESLPLRLERQYRELGDFIMQDICRRIKKAGEITSTADWQMNRLLSFGASTAEIEAEVMRRLNLSYEEMYNLYDKVLDWEYVRNRDLYEQVNTNFVPYEENLELQQLTNSIIQQTRDELTNISNSLGYAVSMNGRIVFTPLSEYYQRYVDSACLGVASGTVDYNSAIRTAVTQMANSGLRTEGVTYASGHSDRVEVAARRAVLTGVSQLTGYIARTNAERLGTDQFEVEWHAGARNTGAGYLNHQSWQGKVYSLRELEEVCGLGQGGGLNGWNCYHTYYPFIPGISKRQWTDEELEERNSAENAPHYWNGREYSYYELTQKQRQMERSMRAQREMIQGLRYGNADSTDITAAQARYRGQMYVYKQFCERFNFYTQMERVYQDMRGRQA